MSLDKLVYMANQIAKFFASQGQERAVTGTADAALPERGHAGTDPEARTDSEKRVTEWLAR